MHKDIRLIAAALLATLASISTSAQPSVSIAKFLGNRQAAVSLTFDDGIAEHATLVAPELEKNGLRGTFGINGSNIGNVDDAYAPHLTWDQIRAMERNGHEINNHGWEHLNLKEQPEMIAAEFGRNDSAMIAELGHAATSVLLPYNAYGPEVLEYCESRYVGIRLSQFGLGQRNCGATRESIATWLRGIVSNGEWGVTMTHGIRTGWDQWDEPQVLWDLFRTLGTMKDSVWVETFANVMAYAKERDAASVTAKTKRGKTIVEIECPLPSKLFNAPLTLLLDGMEAKPSTVVTQDGKRLSHTETATGIMFDADPHGGKIVVE